MSSLAAQFAMEGAHDVLDKLRGLRNLWLRFLLLKIKLLSGGVVTVSVDEALVHRMVANLLDNKLKHLPKGTAVTMRLGSEPGSSALMMEDNGPGFALEIFPYLFDRRVKKKDSSWHGPGLAFIEAVARAHGGSAIALNRLEGGTQQEGGTWLEIRLPLPLRANEGVEATTTLVTT